MPEKRCVVIGGGISGMTAAILMAGQDFRTAIVEASPRLAPLLRGFDRKGWHFETGFHYAQGLDEGGALRRWFSALGLELGHGREVTEITETGSGFFPVPCALEDVERHFPESVAGYNAFCQDVKELQLQSPYLAPASTGAYSPFKLGREPLLAYLDSLGLSRNLQETLLGRCLLYGVAPDRAARDDFFLISGQGKSARAVRGGGTAIAEAFTRRIRELDIECVLGQAVTRIITRNRRVAGVEAEDKSIPANIVIYTGNPARLRGLLPDSGLRPAWFSHLELMEPTPEAVVLYGVCDASMPELHAWYLTGGGAGFRMLEDPHPTLCVMTGEADGQGNKTCMIMGLTRNAGERRDLESLALARLPGLKTGWRKIGSYGGGAMRRHIHGSDGSVFGYAHACDSMPVLPITRMHGLYLAGQGIQLPGLLGCIISAAIAVSLVCGQEATLRNFRKCAGA